MDVQLRSLPFKIRPFFRIGNASGGGVMLKHTDVLEFVDDSYMIGRFQPLPLTSIITIVIVNIISMDILAFELYTGCPAKVNAKTQESFKIKTYNIYFVVLQQIERWWTTL